MSFRYIPYIKIEYNELCIVNLLNHRISVTEAIEILKNPSLEGMILKRVNDETVNIFNSLGCEMHHD